MASRGNERRRFILNRQQAEVERHRRLLKESFRCYLVEQSEHDIQAHLVQRTVDDLPPGDVLIRVTHSSLNYKDAMAATGHRGIVRNFPHVPGIDAVGIVVDSLSPRFLRGDLVLATGHEIGVERWGGWSDLLRVPSEWVLSLPNSLTPVEAMCLGTAGFTAAQCVAAIIDHGITPDRGEVVVTGATGGVGSLSVAILGQLGYRVVAVSGKPQQAEWLRKLGATRVLYRDEFLDTSSRALLSSTWAGGVDTVGGQTLATMIRSTNHRGCVAACGVVGGGELPLTVYPFILRGVTLAGIDSAWCPDDRRTEIWRRLSEEWKPAGLEQMAHLVSLEEVQPVVKQMLAGQTIGRTVIVLDQHRD